MLKRLLLGGIFLLLWGTGAYAEVQVEGIRIWDSPENTRIVFDISQKVEYKTLTLSKSNRVVVDLKDTTWSVSQLPDLKKSEIKKIRHAKHGKGGIRVVLECSELSKMSSFILGPNETYGHRLVLDLKPKYKKWDKVPKFDSTSRKFRSRDLVIAIDPGHGGEDPGAVGKYFHTREKDIVLEVARTLEKLINQTPGLHAFLTRSGDYYVGLRRRTMLARKQGADLFISIHADSFHNPKAQGASIYVVSERGASSEAAKWLADKENQADLVGGLSLEDKEDLLAQVLLDLSQSATKVSSYQIGDSVLNRLAQVSRLHKHHVQKAGFMVLKSPDIPSILVELGFISNREGEKNLRQKAYQEKLARAILEGVQGYAETRGQPIYQPASPTELAFSYEVVDGDSLDKIAFQFVTTPQEIKTLNHLTSETLAEGQVLHIPKRDDEEMD